MTDNEQALTPEQEGWEPCQYEFYCKESADERARKVWINAWYKRAGQHGYHFLVRVYVEDLPDGERERLLGHASTTKWVETFASAEDIKFLTPPFPNDVLPFDELERP